ncbi:ATP-binding cassette domain-containing protein [Aquincola sp. MAHUQ-54]|uniref:ATP-binding cassette domain-containing protein n=1 Tax=Aquincola agrisoli TaxID=3119538 RepID=A0AAW9QAB6_9BURK
MIEVQGLRKSYGGREVLRLDRWQLPSAASCCVTGPSGSGKSTLLEILCALRPADAGTVHVGGTAVHGLARRASDRWRGRTVGVVTQSPHLLDILSVEENVALAAHMAAASVDRRRVGTLLERLGIAHLARRRTRGLSQGERQRVVLARALLCGPSVVVADEPTSHLDDEACEALCTLLAGCCAEAGATLVVATHDRRILPRFQHRLQLARVEAI